MKITALISVFVALAVANGQDGYDGGAGSTKTLSKDIARYQGCLLNRLLSDFKNVDCGPCKDGKRGSLVDCVCRNKGQVAKSICANSDICLPKNSPFSDAIKEIDASKHGSHAPCHNFSRQAVNPNADYFQDGLGISVLCGAYESENDNGGYNPGSEPF